MKLFFFGVLTILWGALFCQNLLARDKLTIPQNRVMSIKEFKKAIDQNRFLLRENLTTINSPLNGEEVELIEIANKNQNKCFGGRFDFGREIENFNGSTLLVGGGKTAGNCGENDGKTILYDFKEEEELKNLVRKLKTEEGLCDPFTGKIFKTKLERNAYIKELEDKISVYEEAFTEKNKDILERYYILNIEEKIFPDMAASVVCESDMNKIPDNKFMHVEFENVSCDVFINPKLYPILERITKPGGSIAFSISYACRRLIVPVIEKTKFGNQFVQQLKKQMYDKSEKMDSTYGACNIKVINES